MATWLITAALSTAIVGFFFLIAAAFRGIRRGIAGSGPATSGDTSWMFFGGAGDTSHSAGFDGHHGHDAGGCDSGGQGCDSGASDGGGCGGGDGGGGGGE